MMFQKIFEGMFAHSVPLIEENVQEETISPKIKKVFGILVFSLVHIFYIILILSIHYIIIPSYLMWQHLDMKHLLFSKFHFSLSLHSLNYNSARLPVWLSFSPQSNFPLANQQMSSLAVPSALSTSGSLPDLSSLHLPSPLPVGQDSEPHNSAEHLSSASTHPNVMSNFNLPSMCELHSSIWFMFYLRAFAARNPLFCHSPRSVHISSGVHE